MVEYCAMKRVMITTGGTGGHINPALAFADLLKKQEPDCEIIFVGSDDRMEAELIPAHGYQFIGLRMKSTYGGWINKVKSVLSLIAAERKVEKMLKEYRPDACVGFGNYISVPLIVAAHRLGIPTMIHEQNSFAGRANKMLAKYADAIVGCYETNLEQFPKDKVRLLGNPESSLAADTKYTGLAASYGLRTDLPFVLFMMGSLGSSSVAQVLDGACALFDKDFQVLIAAGKANDYVFKCQSDRVKIVPYVDGAAMLKEAELSVTRAGATTLAEITAIGAASVLIPSPYVPNNHQVYNAMELVRSHAAVMIEEKDLTPETLSAEVNRLMHDERERMLLKQNALQLGRRDAAYRMIDWLKELTAHE